MAMGGVPFYLMQSEPGLSTAQIIDQVCFSKGGLLRNEFENLFASLFDKSDQHLRIVEVLQKHRSGMNRNLILHAANIPSGGTASHILEELEEYGFIASMIPYGKKSNDAVSRISGAQIDLIIGRKDATINLCEMKFSVSEYTITADYAKKLRKMKDVFKEVTKTKKNIFFTLITTFGMVNNFYSNEVVSNSLTIDCLF